MGKSAKTRTELQRGKIYRELALRLLHCFFTCSIGLSFFILCEPHENICCFELRSWCEASNENKSHMYFNFLKFISKFVTDNILKAAIDVTVVVVQRKGCRIEK